MKKDPVETCELGLAQVNHREGASSQRWTRDKCLLTLLHWSSAPRLKDTQRDYCVVCSCFASLCEHFQFLCSRFVSVGTCWASLCWLFLDILSLFMIILNLFVVGSGWVSRWIRSLSVFTHFACLCGHFVSSLKLLVVVCVILHPFLIILSLHLVGSRWVSP